MRIDIVTIFPEFFSVLDVSLLGKARTDGLLDVHVHDLRSWTTDRHRTVDDTPYGGGAGMVMKPEPWAQALESILRPDGSSTLVVPTPAGTPFKQSLARSLAVEPHLVFACGRYEGIDARVFEWAAPRCSVVELSLGDYVLNGGEVAAMAMIEAVGRLVPGVARRGVPRGRPARVPLVHEASRVAGPRGPGRPAQRAPRPCRRVAARAAGGADAARPAGPAAGRVTRGWRGARELAPHCGLEARCGPAPRLPSVRRSRRRAGRDAG